MFNYPSRYHRSKMLDMGDMMDSTLFKVLAVGALVWIGAKAIHHMMED
ncbi:MAG TPA: hypothetical protein PKA28_09975 [Methylomusa anaerophila]|uniref:Uncharacterized protein n=1 Tax=Methylomusa anaerophila TaxID=1930071 RepID=A0A348AHT2_9FIRM|nr:hypothetical protein [Methylomusa anaerophila]BBB90630.1 hypothetical protein MAMMFC1_01288 [Methylomusa anaerophila]HML88763.1 hypothetical protein [Methylomusa anaerophila]